MDDIVLTLDGRQALGLILLIVFMIVPIAVSRFPHSDDPEKTPPLIALQKRMGLETLNSGLFFIATVMWALIFLSLFLGLLSTIWFVISSEIPSSRDDVWDWRFTLVGMAALTATLGAVIALPFTLIRLSLTREQTNTAAEGLITDRISKAVEGLGSEKETSSVGRPVTVWTGKPKDRNRSYVRESDISLPSMSVETSRSQGTDSFYNSETDDFEEYDCGYIHFKVWPQKETLIEREGEPLSVLDTDHIHKVGDWQVFKANQPNLEVRIGSIYALERISQDSSRDHIQIMEILCEYVRNNFPATSLEPTEDLKARPKPRADLQAIIKVLGRRSTASKQFENRKRHRLDLRNSDLSGCDFRNSDFSGAMFHFCRIEAAYMREALMHGAQFIGSLLNHTEFFKTDLTGADLRHAIINKPEPRLGGMSASITFSINKGLNVSGADITAIDYLGEPDKANQIFGSKNTKLSYELSERRAKVGEQSLRLLSSNAQLTPEDQELWDELWKTGFIYWFPYDDTDGAYSHSYDHFMKSTGLHGFPYRDV